MTKNNKFCYECDKQKLKKLKWKSTLGDFQYSIYSDFFLFNMLFIMTSFGIHHAKCMPCELNMFNSLEGK